MKVVLHIVTMIWTFAGLTYFYLHKEDFNPDPYSIVNARYYLWAKMMDLLLVLCIAFPLAEAKNYWLAISVFFLIRFAYDFFEIKDYSKANEPSNIFVLLMLDATVLFVIIGARIFRKNKNKGDIFCD